MKKLLFLFLEVFYELQVTESLKHTLLFLPERQVLELGSLLRQHLRFLAVPRRKTYLPVWKPRYQ